MRRRFHIILISFICFSPAMLCAQPYMGNNNNISVDQIKGCAPFSFTVTHVVPGTCAVSGDCSARFRDPNTNAILKTIPFITGDVLTQEDAGPFLLQVITTSSVTNDELLLTATENIKPNFEVYACQSGSIQVKVTDVLYDHYKINGAGAEITQDKNDPAFNYTFPMPYPANATIRVRGVNDNMADNCADSIKIVPIASLPAININAVTVADASSVELTHDASPAIQYRLMVATNNATTFQFAKTIYSPPTTTETLTSILPDVNYYCFRMDIFSPCSNTTIGNSNVVCSINFDAVAQNNYNALSWTFGPGSTSQSLTKDGAIISLSNVDSDVTCNVAYLYQLTANFGAAVSTSLPKTVTAISTDTPFDVANISAIVDGSSVILDWQQPAGFTATSYTLRKTAGATTGPIANLNALTFADNAYVAPACYTIQYNDACGNQSGESDPSCPIVLSHVLRDDNTIELSWTPYLGWAQNVDHYEVYEDGVSIHTALTEATPAAPFLIPNDAETQIHRYQIVAFPKETTVPVITNSTSNTIEIVKAPNLFYPTAFVPGSTFAENAKFKVFSQFTERIEFKIFNRWGELMYYTTDLSSDGWDGTYKGNPMPEGTYVFTAKITDFAGRTFDRSGTIVLLRKR